MSNLDCCVSGCANRRCSSTKVRFYRLPSGHQVNRRRLWLQAIQQANGSSQELKGNARVCGAHFISRGASMDPNSPDFVPSVFTKQSPKKKKNRYFTGKRRRHHKTSMKQDSVKSPSKADSPVDDPPSVLMDTNTELSEDVQTPSASSVPKDETGTTPIKPQVPTPNKTSPPPSSVKTSACALDLNKMKPVVLLKRIVVPESGYWRVLSNEDSTAESRLVRDEQLCEEQTQFVCENCGILFTNQLGHTQHCCAENDEPSFPCNLCDRSFTSSQHLKRHKLLHVKDARKCGKCGVLFCRRHNHVMSHPIAKAVPQTEEDSSEEGQAKPKKRILMPEQSHFLPGKSDLLPEESDPIPGKSHLKPEENDLMPEQVNLIPEERHVKPEESDMMPEQGNLIPEERHVKPEESDLMPEQGNLIPEERHVKPEESDLMPDKGILLPEERNLPGNYNCIPNYGVLMMFEQSQTQEMNENAQNAVIVTPLLTTTMLAPPILAPLSETHNVPHPVTYSEKFPIPRLDETFSVPHPPVKKSLEKKMNSSGPHPLVDKPSVKETNFVPLPPPCPAAFLKHPERSTSLKIFSPQYLTSAFLRVKRNYDYILSGPVKGRGAVVNEEQVTPRKQHAQPVKKKRIAYDIEVEI